VALRRLVAYRALGLGDLLTAVPALRALARAFPRHRRILAGPAALAPLARLADAGLEVVDCAPLGALPRPLHFADVAVNLHGRGPQSHGLLRAARPSRLIAFGIDGVEFRAAEHEVARWCRLLSESGVPADPAELTLPAPPWPAPASARGATVVHPGAASPARRWPAERWAAVARAERDAGRTVVVTGAAAERPLAQQVASAAGLGADAVLAGRTDVRSLAATVAAAGRLASGDTGVAHLATAFRIPSVTLFGPTPPALWGPPSQSPQHVALWAGRRGDPHAGRPDPGLLELEPAQVIAALACIGRARSDVPIRRGELRRGPIGGDSWP
jgi:ADP-heptose:LPS heptosyltransferase